MAETFGAVAGAQSDAALFNNCADCFGYIQLGCDFGRDFELSQLKLDITRSRIGRWGAAVAVNTDPSFAASGLEDVDSQQAWRILNQIRTLFIEGVNDESSLSTLQNAAFGIDDLLAEAVTGKMEAIARNEAKDVLIEETAKVKVGNHWSDSFLSRGGPVIDKTENKAGAITARGASIVHIGTSFCGRSIFD
ncbi:hypothetical protein NCS56_00888000 [Fusarium sp. Ph1]|nr:hypothetical protein NCS56_00888000 [Fusarium sp. Ph1]